IIKFLYKQTIIPVLCLISWGLTKNSLQHFKLFIILDFIKRVYLSNILRDLTN
ncbi:hypothetical protein K469DRAFT_591761, partial [Zopfia rhizophila CBS 207.26]